MREYVDEMVEQYIQNRIGLEDDEDNDDLKILINIVSAAAYYGDELSADVLADFAGVSKKRVIALAGSKMSIMYSLASEVILWGYWPYTQPEPTIRKIVRTYLAENYIVDFGEVKTAKMFRGFNIFFEYLWTASSDKDGFTASKWIKLRFGSGGAKSALKSFMDKACRYQENGSLDHVLKAMKADIWDYIYTED